MTSTIKPQCGCIPCQNLNNHYKNDNLNLSLSNCGCGCSICLKFYDDPESKRIAEVYRRRKFPLFIRLLKWARQFRKYNSKEDFLNLLTILKNYKNYGTRYGDEYYRDYYLSFLSNCGSCKKSAVVFGNITDKKFTDNKLIKNNSLHSLCFKCREHCECTKCINCYDLTEKKCSNCFFCRNCCKCSTCVFCLTIIKFNIGVCRECDGCEKCCKHTNSMRRINNAVIFHKSSRRDFILNKSKRFIAIEIEVAGFQNKESDRNKVVKAVKAWNGNIVNDGSLPHDGFEINTAPANGDKFIKQIMDICSSLKNEAFVDSSCGLHVHCDARDFSYYDIRKLIFIYNKIEPLLYGMVPKSRLTSHFCRPCGGSFLNSVNKGIVPYEKIKKDVVYGVYGDDIKNIQHRKTKKYDDSRYNNLNLHSWFYRGTIEIRMFNGTISEKKILAWGILWATILDYSLKVATNVFDAFAASQYQFLMEIIDNNEMLKDFIDSRLKEHFPKFKNDKIYTIEDIKRMRGLVL